VASGQTFAIAGLFQRQMSLDGQTPEIADLPVLGPLFRSARYRRDETELVILITPILVKPVRDRNVATPLDRPAPPPPPAPAIVKAIPNSGFVFK
jgi:pilus assembly protein CpaC